MSKSEGFSFQINPSGNGSPLKMKVTNMHVTWGVYAVRAVILAAAVWAGACQADNYNTGAVTITQTADGYQANFGSGTSEKSAGSPNQGCPVVVQNWCVRQAGSGAGHYSGTGTNFASVCAGSVNSVGGKAVATNHAAGCSGNGDGYTGSAYLGGTTATYAARTAPSPGDALCASVLASRQVGDRYVTSEASDGSWYCIKLPPALSCTATDAVINHGTINPTEFDGNQRGGSSQLTCTGTANVTLSVDRNPVVLSNGGTSTITTSPRLGYTFPVQANTVVTLGVNSELHGQVGPGDFQGSTTLKLTVE